MRQPDVHDIDESVPLGAPIRKPEPNPPEPQWKPLRPGYEREMLSGDVRKTYEPPTIFDFYRIQQP